jgi:hypothetical protein
MREVAIGQLSILRKLARPETWEEFRGHQFGTPSVRGLSRSARTQMILESMESNDQFSERHNVGCFFESIVYLLPLGLLIFFNVRQDLWLPLIDDQWWLVPVLFVGVLLLWAVGIFIPGLLLYIAILARSLLLWMAGLLLVRPTAWLLGQDQPGYHIKWFCFALFLIGFHFDLLAS